MRSGLLETLLVDHLKANGYLPGSKAANKRKRATMSALIDVTDAEASFLEMMREGEDFTLTISCRDGHWILAMESPGVGGPPGTGEGPTFSNAWDDLKPWWAD